MAEVKRARRMALVAAAGGVEPLGTGSPCADCGTPRTALNTGICWSDTAKTRLTFHYAVCDACRSARACKRLREDPAAKLVQMGYKWVPTRRRARSGHGTRVCSSPLRRARRGSARCSRCRVAAARRRARTTWCSPPGVASSWHRSIGWVAAGRHLGAGALSGVPALLQRPGRCSARRADACGGGQWLQAACIASRAPNR